LRHKNPSEASKMAPHSKSSAKKTSFVRYPRSGGAKGREKVEEQETEWKTYDYNDKMNAGSFVMDTAGQVETQCVPRMEQGAGDGGRIGRKVTIKSIHLRGHYYTIDALHGNNRPDVLWLYVVLDRNPTGSAVNVTDVFEDDNPEGLANQFAECFPRVAEAKRFRIMKRIEVKMQPNTFEDSGEAVDGLYGGSDVQSFEWYHREDIDVLYKANEGTEASVAKNNIIVLVGATSVDARYGGKYRIRLRYTDS